MSETLFINIIEQFNEGANKYDDFQVMQPKAVEQLLRHYNSLTAFVNACILKSNTDDIEKQLEVILYELRHTNYFDDYQEIDDFTYDVLVLDRNVNQGECNEVIFTIHKVNNKLEVSKFIEYGIKGEDYPLSCTIDDVVYTMKELNKIKI